MNFLQVIGVLFANWWPGFVVGVVSSLLAAYLYGILHRYMNKPQVLLDLESVWGEFAPDSVDPLTQVSHRYSLGTLYYDKAREIYAFDGTNYEDNGDRFCHWETITSHIDVVRRKYFYIFAAQREGALNVVYYAFGVINLGENGNGKLVPIDGHYVSADVDGRPISHSMRKIEALKYDRTANGTALIRLLSSRS